MAKKRPESQVARRRAEREAVRQMCAELGIDEAELLRRTRASLDFYRQQQRKRQGRLYAFTLASTFAPRVSPMEIDRRDAVTGLAATVAAASVPAFGGAVAVPTAAELEALRIEAMKRAAIAKFGSRLQPELAKALIDAIYEAFPPPPAAATTGWPTTEASSGIGSILPAAKYIKPSADRPERAARSSKAEGKPDGD
jgi:surface antigen